MRRSSWAAGVAAVCLLALAWTPSSSATPMAATVAPANQPAAGSIPACACPASYVPVCGSDGVTYGNDCQILKCGNGSVTVVSQGQCPTKPTTSAGPSNSSNSGNVVTGNTTAPQQKPLCRCPRIYMPVCATDAAGRSTTHPNRCVAECEGPKGASIKEGACADSPVATKPGDKPVTPVVPSKLVCACPYIYMPVCATDAAGRSTTYSNKCIAACEAPKGASIKEGACADSKPGDKLVTPVLPTKPLQQRPPCACTREYNPVCAERKRAGGSGPIRRTFPTECVMRCAGEQWKVVNKGPCDRVRNNGMGTRRQQQPPVGAVPRFQVISNGSPFSGAFPRQRPQASSPMCVCPKIYMPVCARSTITGVARTFSNKCQAETCTGGSYKVIGNGPCDSGSNAGATRPPVTTTPPPKACPCEAIWAPVCGSDGKTWSSSMCLKRCGEGVTVAYDGECKGTSTSTPAPVIPPVLSTNKPMPTTGTSQVMPVDGGIWWRIPPVARVPGASSVPRKLLGGGVSPTGPSTADVPADADQYDDMDVSFSDETPLVGDNTWRRVSGVGAVTGSNAPVDLDAMATQDMTTDDFLRAAGLTDDWIRTFNSRGGWNNDDSTDTLPGGSVVVVPPQASGPSADGGPPAVPVPAPGAGKACACPMNWRPVCGDDGITYGNDCMMSQCGTSSVTKAYDGECTGATGAQQGPEGAAAAAAPENGN